MSGQQTPGRPWRLPRLRQQSAQELAAERRVLGVYEAQRAQARPECQARRARILRHPDLREALAEALGRGEEYRAGRWRPESWNGYVPPEWTETRSRNTSQVREDLVAIDDEALRRENAGLD